MQFKLADQPTVWDGLDRADLLYEVAMQVSREATPQVIAVTGDWGSGKTSFLRQLQIVLWPDREDPLVDAACVELKNHTTVETSPPPYFQLHAHLLASNGTSRNRKPIVACPVIWFDAWKYQNEPVPVVALLHEIRNAFSQGQKFWRFIVANGRAAIEATLLSSETIAEAIGTKAPLVKGGSKYYERFKKSKESGEMATFSSELSTEKIERLLTHDMGSLLKGINYPSLLGDNPGNKGASLEYPTFERRLVVVIDDLDRCEPEVAVRMLEGIKVFLSIPNCVFVLGINEQRLIDHVASTLDDKAPEDPEHASKCRHKAKDYLDKIINRQYALGINRSRSNLAQNVFKGFENPNWDCTGEELDKVNVEILEYLQDPYLLPPNPRKLKAFVATLARYGYVRFLTAPDVRMLFVFAYLAHFHPRILRKISYYQVYRDQFFQWVAAGKERFDDELWPHPTQVDFADGDAPAKDPIDDNIFHVHRIAKQLDTDMNTLKTAFKQAYDDTSGSSEINLVEKDAYVEKQIQEALRPYYLLA